MGFLEDIRHNIIIGDGAMGTLLYSYGMDRSCEEFTLSHPEQIKQIHQAYLDAGAQVIQTNTYGANYEKLSRYGLEDSVEAINRQAVRIAQQAAGDQAYVLGTLGGILGATKKITGLEESKAHFHQQMDVLLSENVDALILETYYDLEELKAVLQMARKETSLPIIAQLTLHEMGVVEGGTPLQEAFHMLEELGADVIGLNCRLGPYHMIHSLEKVALPTHSYLSAFPNASLPEYTDGRFSFPSDPHYFEKIGRSLRDQGVRLVGGCCGTTPKHIRALAQGLKDLSPISHKEMGLEAIDIEEANVQSISRSEEESRLEENGEGSTPHDQSLQEIATERPSIIVELDTPKQLKNIDRFIDGAHVLHEKGIDALTMADNSLASPRVSNMAMASILKQEHQIRPLVHVTCRDKNLIGLQSHLMGLHALGVDQLLAITGDPAKVGDFPGATSVYDLSSFELIELIKQCNEGISFSGKPLGQKTSFSVAGAFNPNVRNLDRAVARLEKKIRYGADYFISQPMYREEQFEEVYQATKHLPVPIYVGIMPLTGLRNAEFLHNEVPGIKLTDAVLRQIGRHGDDAEKSRAEGIAISKALIDAALQYFNGIYLITPFLRYEMTAELTEYIHEQVEKRSERKRSHD